MSSSQSPVKPVLAPSDRLNNVPPYTLAKVFQDRDEKIRQGVDVIDLGVGNPDMRPPQLAIDALKAALDDPNVQNHRYPSFNGLPEFRAGIATWYQGRFGVRVDPACETIPLVGSKEGIAKLLFAHVNPGDTVLMCTPCYPAYLGVAALTQSRLVEVPLTAERKFLPDLSAVAADDARCAKFICVNYPNNPTGGVETAEFYHDLLRFARDYDLFVISDIAYCDLSLDPTYRAQSFLEFDRDKERTLEFHSFSKSYSMQGWRVGFAAGSREAVANLLKIKSNMDFGVFMAIQRAALAVLTGPQDYCREVSGVYRGRRDAFLAAVHALGYPVDPPRATLYVWMPIPRRYSSSMDFARDLLEKTGVVVGPGSGFGKAGEGFVRIALCVPEARLVEAGRRMREAGFTY
ncbi:MAG TPA: aminotransferase class I/II-fold pyridoxal phosphate-dependent enzyme [Candidatus Saccharimonadaceae bacterium]|jgi:LL-diaminopimelate aminotransferase|nr:aminotransferase class I/II-fold pyridoxal phosphate-dependent enzyme [Candidatus Saccharimonadaceae bacterium]